jgi:hypothetical protein
VAAVVQHALDDHDVHEPRPGEPRPVAVRRELGVRHPEERWETLVGTVQCESLGTSFGGQPCAGFRIVGSAESGAIDDAFVRPFTVDCRDRQVLVDPSRVALDLVVPRRRTVYDATPDAVDALAARGVFVEGAIFTGAESLLVPGMRVAVTGIVDAGEDAGPYREPTRSTIRAGRGHPVVVKRA